jgi:hypothetical protein
MPALQWFLAFFGFEKWAGVNTRVNNPMSHAAVLALCWTRPHKASLATSATSPSVNRPRNFNIAAHLSRKTVRRSGSMPAAAVMIVSSWESLKLIMRP